MWAKISGSTDKAGDITMDELQTFLESYTISSKGSAITFKNDITGGEEGGKTDDDKDDETKDEEDDKDDEKSKDEIEDKKDDEKKEEEDDKSDDKTKDDEDTGSEDPEWAKAWADFGDMISAEWVKEDTLTYDDLLSFIKEDW